MKILLVEDEEYIRETYAAILTKKGHDILEAATGAKAIEIIEKEKPDMIYLDILLADNVTGIDVLKQCKPKFPQVEIVVMSAYQDEYEKEAKRLGAYSFIKKPVFKLDTFLGPLEAIKIMKGL